MLPAYGVWAENRLSGTALSLRDLGFELPDHPGQFLARVFLVFREEIGECLLQRPPLPKRRIDILAHRRRYRPLGECLSVRLRTNRGPLPGLKPSPRGPPIQGALLLF